MGKPSNPSPSVVYIDDVTCVKETEKAILVQIDHKEIWIPKKLISDDSEVYEEGHEGTLAIPDWFAEEKGIGD